MQETNGDMWTHPAEVKAVTTNGSFSRLTGNAMMGAGCAGECRTKYPETVHTLGKLLKEKGSHVHLIRDGDPYIVSYPTIPDDEWRDNHPDFKEHWASPIELVVESAKELVTLMDTDPRLQGKTCVIPRPGCGIGGLKWEDVKPHLEPILDDRFIIITF